MTDLTDINHPPHYTNGSIETIKIIESMGDGPAFCRANIIKYLSRHELKNGLQDLEKARWYLDRLITLIKTSKSRPKSPSKGGIDESARHMSPHYPALSSQNTAPNDGKDHHHDNHEKYGD